MKYKTKKKIYPLKLSDVFYNDLKYVARNEGVPVSVFVRKHLKTVVMKKVEKLRSGKLQHMSLYELVVKHQIRGTTYHDDRSVDELLYGGKLHADEK